MLQPDDENYDERSYLRDAARAQKAYWVDQKRTYWPTYGGQRMSLWEELRWLLWIPVVIALFIGIVYLFGGPHQTYPPASPQVTIPTFDPNATTPSVPYHCPTTTTPGQYVPAVCQ